MKEIVCTHCRYYGKPTRKKPGSDGLAIAAWFVFPLGLPYTLWRVGFKKSVCKSCDNTDVVDAESPAGQRLIALIIGENVDETVESATQAIQFDLFAEPTVQKQSLENLPESALEMEPEVIEEFPPLPEPVSLTPPIEPREPREHPTIDPDEW